MMQERARAPAEMGKAALNRGNEIFQKDLRVLVTLIQTVPANRQVGIVREIHEQARLAIARRGGDEEQLAVNILVEKVEQARATEYVTAPRGDDDFGD